MKRILLLCTMALFGLCGIAQNVSTASSTMTASPWTVRVPYDIADEGTKYEFKFGMGGWSWDFFAYQQRNHCGKENLGIARVGFVGRYDASYTALTDAQKSTMDTELNNIVQTGVKSIFLLCGIGNLGDQQGDAPSKPSWNETTRTNYVDDIVRAVEYVEGKGYEVFAVAPFNEPDFEKTYTGNASNFNAVAQIMQTKPQLAGKVFGPSTLNSTEAKNWYPTVKNNVNYANTHQLAGSKFTDYTNFWEQAYSDGKLPVADEMHNVMEPMVCINYGGVAGTWWGWEGITRGEYVRMINNGRQLVYKERPNEWMTTSVNKYPGSNFAEAFIGTSERQAVASAFTYVSKGRLAYYDGYGPSYDYTEEVPGDPSGSYQKGQTNAERLINIYTGEDVPVEPVNGRYKIVNKVSGKVISLPGGSLARQGLYQWADGGLANQVWDVYPIDKTTVADYSYVVIRNTNTSSIPLYFDAQAWNMESGAAVSAWSDGDDASTQPNGWQRWHLRYVGDGYYHIINHLSGLYISVSGSSDANGASIVEWKNDGSDKLLWKFVPADNAVDVVAPSTPSDLIATPQSGAIKLAWTANKEEDVDAYMVYRYNDLAGIWECIGRKIQGTAFLDNTCRKGQTLRYRIKALDKSYNLSEASAEVTAQTTADNALIGQWTGLSLKDNTSNKLNAVVSGATFTTDSDRPAISFDGSDDYVNLPYHVGDMKEMTFAAWVKGSSTTAWQRIFDFGNGEDEYLFLTPTNGSAMRFEIKKDGVTQGLNATTTLGTGTWKHIAVTIGEDKVTIYIDGVANASTSDITLRPSDIAPAMSYLGRSQFDADPAFKGMVSDVRIYNYELTAEEVEALTSVSVAAGGLDLTAERLPNIADDISNWDFTGSWTTWTSTADGSGLSSPYLRIGTSGTSKIAKTLNYLPEGTYSISASCMSYYYYGGLIFGIGAGEKDATGITLFANNTTTAVNTKSNKAAKTLNVQTTLSGSNTLEFGMNADNTNATILAMDDVKLVYQGTTAEYVEGIENITFSVISEVNALLDRPMNATASLALQPVADEVENAKNNYINKVTEGTATPDDVSAWIDALESVSSSTAIEYAEASAEAYSKLGTQISAAYAAATNYPQEYGNETFADELGAIEAKYMAGEYADSEIDMVVLEVKGTTNRYLMADAIAYAQKDNPIDVTALVVSQASFEDNTYLPSWIAENGITTVAENSVEFFNKNYNFYQTLIGMPAGTYRLETCGFYRYGRQVENYSAYINGNLQRNAKLYITHSTEGTQTADVMAISDDPSQKTAKGAWYSQMDYRVPDNMVAAAYAIDEGGKYQPKDGYNSVTITVSEIGDLTIGVKKEKLVGNDWSFFGNFSLYYLGANDNDDNGDNGGETDLDALEEDVTIVGIYTLGGVRISDMQEGVNILHMSDGTVKMVIGR